MVVQAEHKGKLIQRFEYPLHNRLFDGLLNYLLACFPIGAIWYFLADEKMDVLTVTGVTVFLFSIYTVSGIVRHQSLEVYENGLDACVTNKKFLPDEFFNFLVFPKKIFISWARFEKLDSIIYSDWDSIRRNSGIRLWVKGQKVVVWEELEGFSELISLLYSRLAHLQNLAPLKAQTPPTKKSGNVLGIFVYNKWKDRCIGYRRTPLTILGIIIVLTILGFSLTEEKVDFFNLKDHQIKGLCMLWGLFGFVGAINFSLGRKRYLMMQPVVLTDNGIQAAFLNKKKQLVWYWQEAPSIFIQWDNIHLIETSFPGDGSRLGTMMGIPCAISLYAGIDKILIFSNIGGFAELVSILESKLAHLPKPAELNEWKKQTWWGKTGSPIQF